MKVSTGSWWYSCLAKVRKWPHTPKLYAFGSSHLRLAGLILADITNNAHFASAFISNGRYTERPIPKQSGNRKRPSAS